MKKAAKSISLAAFVRGNGGAGGSFPRFTLKTPLFVPPPPERCSPMLTDAECKNATCPPEKSRARLACSGGLYLEVSPAGSKRWFYKYRKDGKEGRMALGSYPDVGPKDARKARDAAKLQKAGEDLHYSRAKSVSKENPQGVSMVSNTTTVDHVRMTPDQLLKEKSSFVDDSDNEL